MSDIVIVCKYCSTIKWKNKSKGVCCLNIKIKLKEIPPSLSPRNQWIRFLPVTIQSVNSDTIYAQFMCNIRRYNNISQKTTCMSTNLAEWQLFKIVISRCITFFIQITKTILQFQLILCIFSARFFSLLK